ncbi:unnamed protein product [Protopolystoma xenopodis]|uniref:Uncharacterized protein n=1 Tax=Protopolystoma xenopodis TaxID=117903 RepID=A0A3S5A6R2_9PLAT|nr:unnamed protein product [Protopolystoma xenopodis]
MPIPVRSLRYTDFELPRITHRRRQSLLCHAQRPASPITEKASNLLACLSLGQLRSGLAPGLEKPCFWRSWCGNDDSLTNYEIMAFSDKPDKTSSAEILASVNLDFTYPPDVTSPVKIAARPSQDKHFPASNHVGASHLCFPQDKKDKLRRSASCTTRRPFREIGLSFPNETSTTCSSPEIYTLSFRPLQKSYCSCHTLTPSSPDLRSYKRSAARLHFNF